MEKKFFIGSYAMIAAFFVFWLVLAGPAGATFVYNENPVVLVRNGSGWGTYDPTLNFVNQDPDPAAPGSYVELRWKVENVGGSATDSLLFEIIPEYPFSMDPGASALRKLGRMESYQVGEDAYVIYYKLKVDENAVEGSSRIKIRYSTNDGKIWQEVPYYVRVKENNFLISVGNVSSVPETVKPGDDVKLAFTIQNLASSDIKNVGVELALERVDTTAASVVRTPLPFSPVASSDEKVFPLIGAKQPKDVEFRLSVDADAESKVHKVPVTVTYQDIQGNSYSKEFMVGIKVREKPDYLLNLEDNTVYKNKQLGKFVVSISNRGFSKMNFLTVKLKESKDYSIVSADTVYIGNLNSDDFGTAEFQLYTDTAKEVVQLPLEITYKDNYNQAYLDVNSDMKINLYTDEQAITLGYQKPSSKANLLIMIAVLVVLTVFWLFMLVHAIQSKEKGFHKTIWVVMIIATYVLGALIYYIVGRKKTHE